MVTWIVVAVVVLALLVALLAVRSVAARLPRLDRSVRRLQLREEQANRLQGSADELAATLAGLQERGQVIQDQLTVIQAARGRAGGR